MDIKQGDKLLVIVRGDKKGLLLIKAEVMDEFLQILVKAVERR